MKKIISLLKDESGQGMTEYALIIVLIGIALIAVTKYFGNEISSIFARAGESLEKGTNPTYYP